MAKKQQKPKKVRSDALVCKLLQYLEDKIGGPLDGYRMSNYDACEELIARCVKHGSDPEATIKALIDAAVAPTCWHRNNATNFRYLLNHGRQIWNAHRAAGGDGEAASGDSDKKRRILESIARESASPVTDNA